MAHFASTDKMAEFCVIPDSTDTTLGILGHEVRLPFLNYRWIILGLGQIAGYMLQLKRFTEVVMKIAGDGVLFVEGLCLDEECDGSRLCSSSKVDYRFYFGK